MYHAEGREREGGLEHFAARFFYDILFCAMLFNTKNTAGLLRYIYVFVCFILIQFLQFAAFFHFDTIRKWNVVKHTTYVISETCA